MKKGKRAFSSNSEFLHHEKNTNGDPNYNVDKNSLSNIKASVIDHKLIHGTGYNEDYVEYVVEVITDYKKWTVKKRYSEFYELNKKLSEKIPELKKLFPPKRVFKTSVKTIEERKEYFNNYLHFLFNNKNIFTLTELLDFIEIEQKIIELYLKKHTMVKSDPDSITYKALKDQFDKMSLRTREEKSKSVGETINMKVNTNSSLSTKINSKEEINQKVDYFNLNKINNSIMESCDSIYEVEDLNTNYFSTLLDFEKANLNYQYFDSQENKNLYDKESGTIVIQEFLKNLSQDIDNKTDIVKFFEEFLKQRQEWPKFSNADINKLFVGNNPDFFKVQEKRGSLNLSKSKSTGKSLNNLNLQSIDQNPNVKKYLKEDYDINGGENNPNENCIYKGLFHYIGEFDKNVLLSISCLNFLAKLLDNEFNPEVELYLKIFKSRRLYDFQLMKLEDIIKYNKGGVQSTNNAIKILSIISEDKSIEYMKKYLVKDDNILKKLQYK